MSKERTAKQYRRRGKALKGVGLFSIFTGAVGGFIGYESYIDWSNFQSEMQNIMVVSEETTKLNLLFALPVLAGFMVFLWILRKKNKEFFKDKMSLTLLTVIMIGYLVYSIIEVTMFAMVGAFGGTILDEFIFTPLSNVYKSKAGDRKDEEAEYNKEVYRIRARKKANEEIGSV